MIERFFQVLKEQLLWLREFEDEDDLSSPSALHHVIPHAFVFDPQRRLITSPYDNYILNRLDPYYPTARRHTFPRWVESIVMFLHREAIVTSRFSRPESNSPMMHSGGKPHEMEGE